MGFDLVVVDGMVMTPTGGKRLDVGVRDGKIAFLGTIDQAERNACPRLADAHECLVIPGAIDAHTHFALPAGNGFSTVDDFDTGTQAAAAGGVTTLIDFTTPASGQQPTEAYSDRRRLIERGVHVDYGLHNVLIGWRPEWESQLMWLGRSGAPSVKLFSTYRDRGWQADDRMLVSVMECCSRHGLVVCLHAENDALIEHYTRSVLAAPRESPARGALALTLSRPPIVEEEAVTRAITFARATGVTLHLVHLSTEGAARMVGEARKAGLPVTGETCPHYLALDRRSLARPDGHRFGCCPPLRDVSHQAGLWSALREGWLSLIATDHCAFSSTQKDVWQGDFQKIPYGLPGVETSLALTYTFGPVQGNLTVDSWVKLHCEGPARTFGLYPQKGVLLPGADADLVIWDASVVRKVGKDFRQTPCDWSPYEGLELCGLARQVFLRGTEIAVGGHYCGPGREGRFVSRSPCPSPAPDSPA